jgi:hypothetical protein
LQELFYLEFFEKFDKNGDEKVGKHVDVKVDKNVQCDEASIYLATTRQRPSLIVSPKNLNLKTGKRFISKSAPSLLWKIQWKWLMLFFNWLLITKDRSYFCYDWVTSSSVYCLLTCFNNQSFNEVCLLAQERLIFHIAIEWICVFNYIRLFQMFLYYNDGNFFQEIVGFRKVFNKKVI